MSWRRRDCRKELSSNNATIPSTSTTASKAQRIPPRQTRHDRHPAHSAAAISCICAASHEGRQRRYLSHCLRPPPPPAAPEPPPGLPRAVAKTHRARSGRSIATTSLGSAPRSSAHQSTSSQTHGATTFPLRPQRTDAALEATEKVRWIRARATRGPPVARHQLCPDSSWHCGSTGRPPALPPALPPASPPARGTRRTSLSSLNRRNELLTASSRGRLPPPHFITRLAPPQPTALRCCCGRQPRVWRRPHARGRMHGQAARIRSQHSKAPLRPMQSELSAPPIQTHH